MRPYAIEQRLKLRNPIYLETSAMGIWGVSLKLLIKHSIQKIQVKEKRLNFYLGKLDFISKIKNINYKL